MGFTLVELMVASVISILLLTLLLTGTQGVIATYRQSSGGIVRQGDAAFAADQLILDLEGLVVPNMPNAEALRVRRETVNGVVYSSIAFLTAATDRDPAGNHGATRAVSYKIAYQNTVDAGTEDPSFALYRSLASAQHTFDNAIGVANLWTDYWDAIPSAPAPAPTATTSIGNFVSANIVGLDIRFLRADNGEWTKPEEDVSISSRGAFVGSTPVEGGFQTVEISLTVLSPDVAGLLNQGALTLGEAITRGGKTTVRQTAFFGR
jgi:type II secretory pathway pseudopilin PulG